jgi:hypothetical protein
MDGGFSQGVDRGAEIKENVGQRSSMIPRREPPGEIYAAAARRAFAGAIARFLDKVGQPNAVQKRQRQTRVSVPMPLSLPCRISNSRNK